jgi:hypothetical protein
MLGITIALVSVTVLRSLTIITNILPSYKIQCSMKVGGLDQSCFRVSFFLSFQEHYLLPTPITHVFHSLAKSQSFLSISSHTRLDPCPACLCHFLHLGWIFQRILDGMRRWYVATFLESRTRGHEFFPLFQSRKLIDINTRPSRGGDPTPLESN